MAKLSWKPGNMLYPVPAVMVSCKREGEKPNIITVDGEYQSAYGIHIGQTGEIFL